MIQNQKGQAFVETTIVMLTMILLIKLTMVLFLFIFSSLWIQHSLYQGLVCLAEGREVSYCKENIKTQIKRVVPLGHIQNIKLLEKHNNSLGSLTWFFYKKNWHFTQDFVLP